MVVKCRVKRCVRMGTSACKDCENNEKRNSLIDGYNKCDDNDPAEYRCQNGRYKTVLVGTAEQGGLQCPACRRLNNAYTFDEDKRFEC